MKTTLLFPGLLALALVGCGKDDATTQTATDNGGAATGTTTAAEVPTAAQGWKDWDKELDVRVADWAGIQQYIAEQKGKVVVVDMWATWCEPCIREFPGLVKLQQKYPGQVVATSVNLNYAGLDDETPESFVPEVKEFLEEKDARFVNFISSQPDEKFYEAAEFSSVPTIFVYDKTGKLRQKVDVESAQGDPTYADHVAPLVEELLKE